MDPSVCSRKNKRKARQKVPKDLSTEDVVKKARIPDVAIPDVVMSDDTAHDKGKMKAIEDPKDLSDMLTLFCWVKGDTPEKAFHVDIAGDKTVSHLKESIREEQSNTFRGVDASTLKIWKVDINMNANFANSLADLKLEGSEDVQPLKKPQRKLSKIFSGDNAPKEEHLHIAVEPPAAEEDDRDAKKRRSNEYQSFIPNTRELKSFMRAFETTYKAPYPRILLSTMDLYTPQKDIKYFNRSFSMVQSSGMGKSRMVNYSATLRFTFQFNLHKDMPQGSHTYPPFDRNVRDYLTVPFEEEEAALTRHFAFLEALFTRAVEILKTFSEGTPSDVANAWLNWMSDGATSTSVGTNRTAFYDQVIIDAKGLEKLPRGKLGIIKPQVDLSDVLDARAERLQNAAKSLCHHLQKLHGDLEDQFLAVISIDEAHTLQKSPDDDLSTRRNPYFALMHVLTTLANTLIFVIFLSTNSNINVFAPTDAEFPSLRVQQGWKLIPPFIELPFDCFCEGFTDDVKSRGKLTLKGVCELEQMTKFGRPMWHSHYINVDDHAQAIHPTIELATMKLGIQVIQEEHLAQLAALDCRVLIRFDPIHSNSRSKQAELVERRMRTVFNVPESREFIWSGYPSEPLLAEAAARLLNGSGRDIKSRTPVILERALNDGLLAHGERGELVARTLFTVAHDEAIIKRSRGALSGPRFHQPVKLVDVLKSLLAPAIWEVVRIAKPEHAYGECLTLEVAFKDAWVNFSHFVQLGDHASFNLHCASQLLKRGAAMQTFDNQYNMDGGLPLLFGNQEITLIEKQKTSILQYKIKNTQSEVKVFPDPSVVGSSGALPIISLVMQLGVEKDDKRVVVHTVSKSVDNIAGQTRIAAISHTDDILRRHYSITLYGCTSETYSCVPEIATAVYRNILRAQKPFADFPRAEITENEQSLHALKPMIYDKSGIDMPW